LVCKKEQDPSAANFSILKEEIHYAIANHGLLGELYNNELGVNTLWSLFSDASQGYFSKVNPLFRTKTSSEATEAFQRRELTPGDSSFIHFLMRRYKVTKLAIAFSESTKVWPDLWIELGETPRISLTREWASHDKDLRRSQILHEFCHIGGLEHGKKGKLDFNTHPNRDSYSKNLYRQLISGPKRHPRVMVGR
jgi:hypothetical protein